MNQRSLFISGDVDWDFISQGVKNNQITKLIIGYCGRISKYGQNIDNIKYLHILDEGFDDPEAVLYFIDAVSTTVQCIQIDNAKVLKAFYTQELKCLPCLEIIRQKNNELFFNHHDPWIPRKLPKLRIIKPMYSDWCFDRIENKKCLRNRFGYTLYHIIVNQMRFMIMFTFGLCLRRFFAKDLVKMIIQKCDINPEPLVKKQLIAKFQFAPRDKRTDEEQEIFDIDFSRRDLESKVANFERNIALHKKEIGWSEYKFDLEYEKLLKKIEK